MSNILVREQVPGMSAARTIMAGLEKAGIRNVQLFFDDQAKIWAVCQVEQHGGILLPDNYQQDGIKPYILWYCKDETGHAREPSEKDLFDILTVVNRASSIWDQGEKRADKFDALDAEKDRKHKEKFRDRIHDIAKPMKKAIKEGKF